MVPSALRRLWPQSSPPGKAVIRTVEVQPPSQADEVSWVFLTGALVVLGVLYLCAFERDAARGPDAAARAASALLPYQVLFRDLPSPEQRIFRAMQEGVAEALPRRATSGDWPSVESLAAAEIPPFARDVLDKSGLRWSLQRDGLLANYIGIPSTPAPAFLILVLEPDPVTGERPPPPSVVDEEHQLLADGTLLHVTYWRKSSAAAPAGIIADPAIAGWQQIRLKSPFEEIDAQ